MHWQIGNGASIQVYSQPWFGQWQEYRAGTLVQRQMKVQSLFIPGSRNWDFGALQEIFGYWRALQIVTNDRIKPLESPANDSLIFSFAKNGKFSIKKAYQLLKGDVMVRGDKNFWDWLWNDATLQPKLRMFIWRCCWKAIPVQAVLAARIRYLSTICKICGAQDESVMHAIFHCDFARAVWMRSLLGLRTDRLTGTFQDSVLHAKDTLSDRDFILFVSTMWAIWRTRNEAVYGGKNRDFKTCKEYTRIAAESSTVNYWCACL